MSDWMKRAKPLPLESSVDAGTWKNRALPRGRVLQGDDDHVIATPEGAERLTASDAALLGAGQGGALGFADEAHGVFNVLERKGKDALQALGVMEPDEYVSDAIDRPGTTINGKLLTPGLHVPETGRPESKSAVTLYREGRDYSRGINDAAKAEHGNAYLAGELAGALVTPMPKVGKFVKGTPFLARAAQYAKVGLPVGIAAGVGSSKGDLTEGEIGTVALDGLLGGAAGAVLSGAVGPAVENVSAAVANYLRKKAAANAVKAVSPNAGIINRIRNKGMSDEAATQSFGRKLLDYKLVPFFGTKQAAADRAAATLQDVGEGIGDIVDKADGASEPFVDGWDLKKGFDFDSAKAAAAEAIKGRSAVADQSSGQAQKFLEAIDAQAKKTPGKFGGARILKTEAQGGVNWNDAAPLAKELHRDAVQGFTDDFQKQIGDVLGPDELEALRALNDKYGTAADALDLAREAASRESLHKTFGLRDLLFGSMTTGAGQAMFGPKGAAAGLLMPIAMSAWQRRGASGSAILQDRLARLLSSKFAPALARAAAKGSIALAATHYVLSQRDPEYQQLLMQDDGGAE